MANAGAQFFEDMGQVLTGLFGAAVSARKQASGRSGGKSDEGRRSGGKVGSAMRDQARQKLAELAHQLDLVTREDFYALHDMLKAARAEQSALQARLARLEGGKAAGQPKAKAPVKPSMKGKLKSKNISARSPAASRKSTRR